MRRRSFAALGLALALLAPASLPTTSSADFHLVSIREVFPGTLAQPGAEYVEFQAYAAGQNFVSGHSVAFFKADGSSAGAEIFDGDVANGANQMTFTMATPMAESTFPGFVSDEGMASGLLDPAGGAVCWAGLDCVSWGAFEGPLPSPAGSPAAAIPDGMALRRTIAAGCPTLLEPPDDRNNSALDFATVFPAPRPNSIPPSERSCASSDGPSGGSGKQGTRGAPQTTLRRRPPQRARDRTPTFRFASDEAGSTFQCKLDRKPYRRCRSPFTAPPLALGPHTFRVRARDASGRLDPTPAFDSFQVVERR